MKQNSEQKVEIMNVSPTCGKPLVGGSTDIEIKFDSKIYWGVHSQSVIFLIPKKKGIGFLRQPVGHYNNDLSKFITSLGYDCCGLDGYLDINTGYTFGQDFKMLSEKVSDFLKFQAVEVNANKILDFVIK